jgi:hypothetical protein
MSDFLPKGDDLNDFISAPLRDKAGDLGRIPTSNHSKFDREVHGANREHAFKETCPKCGGSGRFTSWAGRPLGECFTCKGVGHKFFATSTETRAKNRDQIAQRKANAEVERVDAFAKAQPAVWAWIVANPTFEFAASLGEKVRKYGSLTENQIAAVVRSIAKRDAVAAERAQQNAARVETAPVVASERLLEAFKTAFANGLKFPKLRLGGLVITKAKDNSSNPGALYVKNGGEYVGKVVSGRFLCTRECPADVQGTVVSVINDPAAAAKASGLQTGSCSCCGRELTDPESVASGIGPICAKKWGF